MAKPGVPDGAGRRMTYRPTSPTQDTLMKRSFRRKLRLARPKALRSADARHGETRRLYFENLEDRRLLAVVEVSPDNLNGWVLTQTGGASAQFVGGPATPPLPP